MCTLLSPQSPLPQLPCPCSTMVCPRIISQINALSPDPCAASKEAQPASSFRSHSPHSYSPWGGDHEGGQGQPEMQGIIRDTNRGQGTGHGTGTGVRAHLDSRSSCTGFPLGHCAQPSPHPRRNGGPQGGRATAWQEALSHSVPGRPGGHCSGRSAVGEGSQTVTLGPGRGSNPDPG